MSQSTLPVPPLLSSTGFPQDFISAFEQMIRRIAAKPRLGTCSWQSPESSSGACNGGHPCSKAAVVHDLASDQEFCARHFREISLGQAEEATR
jgi:hypothetical protein